VTTDPAPLAGETLVPAVAAGLRLDRFLQTCLPEETRSALQRRIEAGLVVVNGAPARAGYRLRPGDRVRWEAPAPRPAGIAPEAIPLDIVHEDDDLLVVNKPKGLVVHPAPGNWSGTLVNALLGRVGTRLSEAGGVERPGIVHRLDRDTSGLLVVARNDRAYRSLQRQIQNRTAERRYLALVRGVPKWERAVVDAPLGRDPRDRKRMAVLPESATGTGGGPRARPATTDLRLLEAFPGFALLEARLQTGRTHQIRVHAAYIGHPVVGDATYGPANPADDHLPAPVRAAIRQLDGQALHAYLLAFHHPRTNERLSFTVPPPADTQAVLTALGAHWPQPPPA
jgi:23S rRNA pseudouridine1911/1915/1917 synthase